MTIIQMPLSEIRPYPNNPRFNENAVDAVEASIREFGFKVPIVIDRNNVIVCGHTRYKAAYWMGLETVPCIMADDLTDEQVAAFRLVDNKTSELSHWDFEKLDAELREILGIDMEALGFKKSEDINIDNLFGDDVAEEEEKEPKRYKCPHCGEWVEA